MKDSENAVSGELEKLILNKEGERMSERGTKWWGRRQR